jgi:hypothetical protein
MFFLIGIMWAWVWNGWGGYCAFVLVSSVRPIWRFVFDALQEGWIVDTERCAQESGWCWSPQIRMT